MTADEAEAEAEAAWLPSPWPEPAPGPEPVETGPDGWARYEPETGPPYWRHEAYPHWSAWLGVADVGYYARRPMSSPPKVVGPLPTLARIGVAIAEAEVRPDR
jgi:hypothetical protein